MMRFIDSLNEEELDEIIVNILKISRAQIGQSVRRNRSHVTPKKN